MITLDFAGKEIGRNREVDWSEKKRTTTVWSEKKRRGLRSTSVNHNHSLLSDQNNSSKLLRSNLILAGLVES
ncbi:unnamed protein product [Lactuca saligna]|uniref:Uncharacterized protein n=1 Tax=Lactuca saligna TaxID=75948 RepID=A0AA35VEH8_LACSI|nr:unnamed protein product [Lactuca saligna]